MKQPPHGLSNGHQETSPIQPPCGSAPILLMPGDGREPARQPSYPSEPFKGVVVGLALSVPLWALLIGALYGAGTLLVRWWGG